jgi:hypothetical protein
MSYRVSRLLTDPEPTTRSVSLYIEMQMIGVLCVGAGPKDCCKPAATSCTNGAQNRFRDSIVTGADRQDLPIG